MRFWTVHAPPRPEGDVVLVPERLALLALLLPLPWLLVHRCWLAALGFVLVAVAIGLAPLGDAAPWAGAALHLLTGLSAQDLRRWTLARRGRPVLGVVAAVDEDEALFRLAAMRPDFVDG